MQYLFNENPLVIDRELAAVIGLNEAIILQQMQYWIKKSEHRFDNKIWIYNSVSQWKEQFPFWSESTINRTIRNLEEKGLLFTGNYNRDRRDRTKWYSINYLQLDNIMKNAFSQNDECNLSNCDNAISQDDLMQDVNLTKPLPKITTKTTTEITTNIIADKPQQKKRACQIPDDFEPTDHHRDIAVNENINLDNEFVKFRDYCLANGKKYIDWDAAFNNWLRNSYKYQRASPKNKPNFMTLAERNRAVLDSMRG